MVAPGAKQQHISAVATVPAAASVSATGKHAVVLVFVDQTTEIGSDAPTQNTSSVRVSLDKVDGRWSFRSSTRYREAGEAEMKSVFTILRRLSVLALTAGWCGATVTSGSTGVRRRPAGEPAGAVAVDDRDIPVAFLAGGPHAAYLLDGFHAGPDVNNRVTAGNGFDSLAGKGTSVVAPAGGAYSMYTNWEQDGSEQWETFLSTELPDWLAANKGLAPGGHGVVGVSQGGYAAAALVTFHPDRVRYAGSLSGFLAPNAPAWTGRSPPHSGKAARTAIACGARRNWAMEMAFAEPEHPAAGRQQRPALDRQPGSGPRPTRARWPTSATSPRHQRDVLLALPRRRRHQRPLDLGRGAATTGRPGDGGWAHVRRSRREHPLAIHEG